MSDSDQGTAEADRPPGPPLAEVAAAPFLLPDGQQARLGQRWNRFTLEAEFPGARHSYLAEDAGLMEKVLITARLIDDGIDWRRRSWAQLCAMQQVKILRCLEAIEEHGWRYEIMAAPPSTTLREWLAAHRPGFDEVEAIVRQVAAMLTSLHDDGLVHLNLRPDTLHIDEGTEGLDVVLGGLQEATLFNQPTLITIDVDPFYAPPEAAGLAQHQPGERLRCWDWWSLGRVVQELMLGHHVLGTLLNRDVSKITPELRTRAEMLLLEREPAGVRAGAVEHMGAEPAALPLLRGLLTGTCDGRWGSDSVQRWLRHETVRDFYDQPRTVRLWTVGGRVFTIKDAAEFFTQRPNWAAGENTLLQPNEPGSLAQFLRETPSYREHWERLQSVVQLAESSGWMEVPALARRTLTAAVGWLTLGASSGSRAVFRVRGHAMDAAGLLDLLKDPGGGESVALLRGLLHAPVIDYVESLDPVAGRVLRGLATRANAALTMVLAEGWLDPNDSAGFTRLFTLALQRNTAVQERLAVMQATYATSRYPILARILANRTPPPVEALVLAFTGETPQQCGFVTHADYRGERYQALKSEADTIAGALRWVRLHQVLHYGRCWGMRWQMFVAVAGGLALAAAAMSRAVWPPLAVALSLVVARAWLWWRVRRTLQRYEPKTGVWSWRDGTQRSMEERTRALAQTNATPGELQSRLQTLRTSMAEFVEEARKNPAAPDPQWWDVAGVFVVSAVITVAALVQATGTLVATLRLIAPKPVAVVQPPPAPMVIQSRVESLDSSLPPNLVADPEGLLATGRYEMVDDGFGRRLRGPLQRWDFYAPAQVTRLKIQARASASAEQAAYAMVSATLVLRPYLRDSVAALLAIQVPTTRGTGLLVFNGRDRRLVDRQVRLVRGTLQERTWYELDGKRVLYLGAPLPFEATNSLAPP